MDNNRYSYRPQGRPAQQREYDARQQGKPAQQKANGSHGTGQKERRLLLLIILVVLVSAGVFSTSGITSTVSSGERLDLATVMLVGFDNAASDAVAGVFEIPKTYALPLTLDPAPNPDESCFYTLTEDGVTYDVYEDATITARLWREVYAGSTVNFADITIASATQLRSAFAGGSYNMSARERPHVMAVENNALVAINCDFYNFHDHGIIIRQGTTYRNVVTPWDVLLIDSNGDFHVGSYDEIMSAGVLDNYTIYNSFSFGPVLVTEGQVNITNYMPVQAEDMRVPRTAIGQLGTRHYLIAAVDGNSDISEGLYVREVAEMMQQKGCITAYNLDGGHSTAMMFHDEVYSTLSYHGQRLMGDILYFATAMPED